MKSLIIFGLIAAASAVPYHGMVNTGASAVQRSDDVGVCYCFALRFSIIEYFHPNFSFQIGLR